MADPNSETIEAWNTVLFDKFVRFRTLLTEGLSSHGTVLLDRHPPREGARVLDLGCGFGDTTIDIAKRVGPRGEAVGVDAAGRFIEVAAREANEHGIANGRFAVADVQTDDLGGPFDHAFSRFGTMFFANPVAALRNVRRSLAKEAKLTMAVWRRKDENPWLDDVERRVLEIVPHPEKQPDQLTCGPGPFSMASADMVSAQLIAAGFGRVTFERFDVEICVGRNLDEAVEFAMALGPAGEILRLAGESAEAKRPQVAASVKDMFSARVRPDGVFAGSSSWLVSAHAV